MRRSACLTLVIASAAMLAAGISTRGARADRSIDLADRETSALETATLSQRPQPRPGSAPQRLAAQRAAGHVDAVAALRHPAGPDSARDSRDEDQGGFEQTASLATTAGRKMRALSMESFEIPADPASNAAAQGQTGRAKVMEQVASRRERQDTAAATDVAPTVIRFDRVVININLAGFGS